MLTDLRPTEEHPIVLGLERQQSHVRAAAGHERLAATDDGTGPDQREHPLRSCESSQRLFAELHQIPALGQIIANQRGDRLGQEDLPAVRQSPQPPRTVDRRTEVVAVALVRLARVDRHAHLQRQPLRPSVRCERLARSKRGADGRAGLGEHAERAVAFAARLEHDTAGNAHGTFDQLVVTLDRHGHRVGRALPQRRGTFDVGEQEGHDASGQAALHTLGAGSGERRVMTADRVLDRSQIGSWLEAELTERGTCTLIRAQRVDLAAASVQRHHQQTPPVFPQRLVGNHRLESRHPFAVVTDVELGLGEIFDEAPVQFLEASDLSPRRGPIREFWEGTRAPERQSRGQRVHRSRVAIRKASPTLGHQPLEATGVHRFWGGTELVSPGPCRDQVRPKRLAQPQHEILHDLSARSRRVLTPERFGQPLGAENLTGPRHERRKGSALLGPADLERDISSHDLDGTKDGELVRLEMVVLARLVGFGVRAVRRFGVGHGHSDRLIAGARQRLVSERLGQQEDAGSQDARRRPQRLVHDRPSRSSCGRRWATRCAAALTPSSLDDPPATPDAVDPELSPIGELGTFS